MENGIDTSIRFSIGQQFKKRSDAKHRPKRVWTIEDILRTYDSNNVLVKVSYVCTADGVLLNKLWDFDVCDTTIAMGLITTQQ